MSRPENLIVRDSKTNSRAILISVIVLNYNGRAWLERCLESLKSQTLFEQIEVLVADNNSPDHSGDLAAQLMAGWSNGRLLKLPQNFGFAEGNNRAAESAMGEWLFFLNNDTWLESDCLEALLTGTERAQAQAATPLVMDYDSEEFQSLGAGGFDFFGLVTCRKSHRCTQVVLMPEGCSYLIKHDVFQHIGGFDAEFFMYAEELDLSWRVWLAGYQAVAVPSARLHHRGAAQVNPVGGGKVLEFRTSDTKRYFANRNALLVLLNNAQHFLLLLLPLQVGLLALEALASLVLMRRWSFVKRAYLEAVADCWHLRNNILSQRLSIRRFRKRGDLWMLRFLCLRLNRWDEIIKVWRLGLPRVSSS